VKGTKLNRANTYIYFRESIMKGLLLNPKIFSEASSKSRLALFSETLHEAEACRGGFLIGCTQHRLRKTSKATLDHLASIAKFHPAPSNSHGTDCLQIPRCVFRQKERWWTCSVSPLASRVRRAAHLLASSILAFKETPDLRISSRTSCESQKTL